MSEKEKASKAAQATELSGEDLEKARGGTQIGPKIAKAPVGPLKMDEVDSGPE
jgi:hypothetical protein